MLFQPSWTWSRAILSAEKQTQPSVVLGSPNQSKPIRARTFKRDGPRVWRFHICSLLGTVRIWNVVLPFQRRVRLCRPPLEQKIKSAALRLPWPRRKGRDPLRSSTWPPDLLHELQPTKVYRISVAIRIWSEANPSRVSTKNNTPWVSSPIREAVRDSQLPDPRDTGQRIGGRFAFSVPRRHRGRRCAQASAAAKRAACRRHIYNGHDPFISARHLKTTKEKDAADGRECSVRRLRRRGRWWGHVPHFESIGN